MSKLLAAYVIPILWIALCVAAGSCLAGPLDALAQGDGPEVPQRDETADLTRFGAWPFGPAEAVDIDPVRDLVFLGSGSAVLILDCADPTNPQLISDEIRCTDLVADLFYQSSTQRLYMACVEGGLEIWDVADPNGVNRLSVTEVVVGLGYEAPVNEVDVYDHFAIVECAWGHVRSLDVSDPTNPVLVGGNSAMGNPATDLYVSQEDGQAHTTGADGYYRLEIEPDGSLSTSGAFYITYGADAVSGTPDVAYAGVGTYVYILNLHSPFQLLSVIDVNGALDILERDGYAYIANFYGLNIWDVHVHTNPVHVGTLNQGYSFSRIVLDGDLAYLAAGSAGLRIVDISDVTQPEIVGSYDVFSYTWDCVLSGDYAFLTLDGDGLLVLDASDLTRPELIAQLDFPGFERDLDLVGERVYVAAGEGGLRIIDVSEPAAPVELGAYEAFNAWRVRVRGSLAYTIESVPNFPYWLRILDISDPGHVEELSALEMPPTTGELDFHGDYLYAAGAESGVLIIDVSDPTQPEQVGDYALPDVIDLLVRGDQLHVASHESVDGGYFILDLSDPVNPVEVGRYQYPGFLPLHLALSGDYAYLNDYHYLHMILISDPTQPLDLGEHSMSTTIYRLLARDQYVFVSNGAAGLQIVENLVYGDPGGGLEWEAVPSGTDQDLLGVHFADAMTGWAVGDGGTIVHSNDGGSSWQPQSSGTSSNLSDVDFVDAVTGWVVASDGTILKTSDAGETWISQESGTSDALASVDFVDASQGWVTGDWGTILHTSNGGVTWGSQVSGTDGYIGCVSFVDPLNGWATGGDFGTMLKTTNGGISWTTVNTGSGAVFLGVDFASQDVGWAVGMFGTVIKTTNGGASWFPQVIPGEPEWLYDVYALDESRVSVVGFDGRIIITVDGGANWEMQDTGNHEQLEAVHFVDWEHGWAVGWNGTILRTAGGVSAVDGVAGRDGALLLSLKPNLPNPFRPWTRTVLRYTVTQPTRLTLKIYDVRGAHVRTLVDALEEPGIRQASWNGCDAEGRPVRSGVYFARLQAAGESMIRKILLIR